MTALIEVRSFQLGVLLLSLIGACTSISAPKKSSSQSEAPGQPALADDASSNAMQPVVTGSTECAGLTPGDLYCDDNAQMHVCINDQASRAVPCGALERCVVVSDRAQCLCVPGAVLQGAACVMGTSCAVDNGGCDPATKCTDAAAGRTCGACPAGYVGDGLQGCTPQLTQLMPSCGELVPPLTPGTYEYRLRVPLLCHSLMVESQAPSETTVTVRGAKLATPSASWPLSPVELGETPVEIELVSEHDVKAQYNIVVERSGSQDAYIKASNCDADDHFGFSISAADDVLLVGAPWEDSASLDPADNSAADSGAVYEFVHGMNGWAQKLYVKPDRVVAGDAFGTSVLLAGDTLFVGAVGQDPLQWYPVGSLPSARSGSVYVFARDNGAWKQTARLVPREAASGDLFGFRMAVNEDTLAIAAPGDGSSGLPKSGAVYIFQLEAGVWVEKQKLEPPTAPNGGEFGFGLSLAADTLLVGAPTDSERDFLAGTAYLFTRPGPGGTWTLAQRLDPRSTTAESTYGWQVFIRDDTALVGAPGFVRAGPPGEVHIFEHSAGTWTLRDTQSAMYPSDANLYGGGLYLSDSVLVVGASGDASGASGVGADAARMDSFQSGAIHLYTRTPDGWEPTTYLKARMPEADDQFGVQTVISPAGLFVGAPYEGGGAREINGDESSNTASRSGAVYVFR